MHALLWDRKLNANSSAPPSFSAIAEVLTAWGRAWGNCRTNRTARRYSYVSTCCGAQWRARGFSYLRDPFSEFCKVRTMLNFSRTANSFGQSIILRREYVNTNLADTEMKAERKVRIIFDFQPTVRQLLTPAVQLKLRNELRSRKEFSSLLH